MLAFLYAVAILFTSERRAADTFTRLQIPLQIAEKHWGEAQDASKLGALLAFRSLLAWLQGALDDAFVTAKQALTHLPEGEMQWRGICLIFVGVEQLQTGQVNDAEKTLTTARAFCEVTGNEFGALDAAILLGEVYLRQAELRQSAQLYQVVLDRAQNTQMERDQATIRVGSALIGLGTLAYEWNELPRCAQQAEQALAIGAQVGYFDLQSRASMLLARLEHVRGETDAAQQRLHTMIAQTAQPRWLTLVRRMRAEQAWIALASGNLAAVEQWAATVPQRKEEIAELQQEQEALLLAQLWIEQGDTDAALTLLERRQTDARAQGRIGNIIEILIIKSLAHGASNDLPQAHATLLEALHLAQPGGYIRLFVDQGQRLAHVLASLAPTITEEPLLTYVQTLLSAFGLSAFGTSEQESNKGAQSSQRVTSLHAHTTTPHLIEPLSERELDVIRLVAAGLATDEVAQELVISVGTVRTHLKHIYAKLDVRSRVQAVERARAFNLL